MKEKEPPIVSRKFKIGQNVTVKRSKGAVENGWKIEEYEKNNAFFILTKKDEKTGKLVTRTATEKSLLSWQTLPVSVEKKTTPPEIKKPEFAVGRIVKVQREDGGIEDNWEVAYYAQNGTSVVVVKKDPKTGRETSKKIPERKLLEWQNQKTSSETGAEKNNQKKDWGIGLVIPSKIVQWLFDLGYDEEKLRKMSQQEIKDILKKENPKIKVEISLSLPREVLMKLKELGIDDEKIEKLTQQEIEGILNDAEKPAENILPSEENKKIPPPLPKTSTPTETPSLPKTPDKKTVVPQEQKGEIKDFITEFGLESLVPKGFEGLTDAQKLKVTTNLKRRIVDIVKADAQTQYSEDLKKRGKIAKIRASFNKESEIKDFERKAFMALMETEEGKKIIAENIELLTKVTKERQISVNNGKPEIIFLNPESATGAAQKDSIIAFNTAANNFREIPYEWGQEKSGKHKKAYEKAKAEYENARNKVLLINEKRMGKEIAMTEMLQLDNAIQIEQLLNTHPEFEKELENFASSPKGMAQIKDAVNFATGGNKLLFAGGYLMRMGVQSVLGAVGAPIAGGIIGGLRGRIRAKSTLEERKLQARYGKKDESKERVMTTDATRLTERLEDLITIIGFAPIDEKQAAQQSKYVSMLTTRIEHTQGKIEKGQVNFGDPKSALANQFNLVNTLNRALVLKESMSGKANKELKARIDRMMETQGKNIAEATSKAQRKFIYEQTKWGVIYGAGFATAGYALRYVGEHLGWWGDHGAENVAPRGNVPEPSATTTPETPEVTPEAPGAAPINEYAVVQKGQGITQAFAAQIKHNPSLAEKLGFDGNLNSSKDIARFTRELAIKTGYMDESGNEIRVMGGNRAFYEIKIGDDGQPFINEGEVDGAFREIHHAKNAFEQDTEKYEYKSSRHHEVIHHDAHSNQAPKPQAPTEHVEAPNIQTPEEILQSEEVSPEPVPPKETTAPRASIGNFTYGTTNEHGTGTNYAYGTGGEQINRGFYGPGGEYREYLFPDLSPEENDFLNHHLDFVGKNPYHLTGEQLIETYNASEQNIDHFWGHDVWNSFKDHKASEAMEHTSLTDAGTAEGKLGDYLTMLKNFSGLKPKGASIFHWKSETVAEFSARALQKIEANGQLEIFEDNLRR